MTSNRAGVEIGLLAGKHPGRVGHLISPGAQRGPWHEIPYALDNGAWPAWKNGRDWNEAEWRHLLQWAAMSGIAPLWAVVPDVVANREQTLARWGGYSSVVRSFGFRCAFAVQDGMTFGDVPDDDCVLFLAGSDVGNWKVRNIEPWCARFPGRVHVARVNTWDRLVKCWRAGAISVDGTGWFRKKGQQDKDLRKFLRETSNTNAPLRAVA